MQTPSIVTHTRGNINVRVHDESGKVQRLADFKYLNINL
jgi:hypothetical protein